VVTTVDVPEDYEVEIDLLEALEGGHGKRQLLIEKSELRRRSIGGWNLVSVGFPHSDAPGTQTDAKAILAEFLTFEFIDYGANRFKMTLDVVSNELRIEISIDRSSQVAEEVDRPLGSLLKSLKEGGENRS